MSDLEELLRQERDAELPPPPDVRYTQAAVRLLLIGESPTPRFSEEGLAVSFSIGTVGLLIIATLLTGRLPLWLLVFPISALCLSPLLLIRRESK